MNTNPAILTYPTIDLFNAIDRQEIEALLGEYKRENGIYHIIPLSDVLTLDNIQSGCPHIYCPEIVDIIDSLKREGEYVYNSTVKDKLPDNPNISWVVYTCQGFVHLREAITRATADAILLKSQGYIQLNDLETNIGKKFLPMLNAHSILGTEMVEKSAEVMVLRKWGNTYGLQKPREKRKYRPVTIGQYVKPV